MKHGVYTTGELAEILRCSPKCITSWIDAGKLKGYRMPSTGGARPEGDRRVPHLALLEFCEQYGVPLKTLTGGGVLLVGVPARLASPDAMYADSWLAAGLAIERHRPGVVVVDLALGRGESIAAARLLRERCPGVATRAIVGEDEVDIAEVVEAFGGWLPRTVTAGELARVVGEVMTP